MSKIIGRTQEIDELQSLYRSDRPEFVAIYGRRRVGKTFLVKEVFKDRFTFVHSGLSPYDSDRRVTTSDQLEAFYGSLMRHGMDEGRRPKSWMEAFALLGKLLERLDNGERQVVFLDELPWMDTPRSHFMMALEHFWNSWGAWHDRLMLIVCGSATSWMLDNLINNKGGLYDRLTWQLKLSPFTLGECRAFLKARDIHMSTYDIVECHMIMGGIPYYLSYLQQGKSLAQNVDSLFFGRNAKLGDEFKRLFGSLFANPETHAAVVRLLAKRNAGFTREEIASQLGMKGGGTFSKILDSLAASDFIMPYKPFGSGKRETRYKLIDNMCLFFLHFVDNATAGSDNSFWQRNINAPALNAWRGIAFELVCFTHTAMIKRALGVENVVSNQSAWVERGDDSQGGTQIDLIIERDDHVVNLCEIKFLSVPYEPDNADEKRYRHAISMLQKHLSPKQYIHMTLVSTYGLKTGMHSGIFQQVVTMEQLF